MSKLITERVFDYLETLRDAIDLPVEQSQSVVDEVSDDLRRHIQRRIEEGASEEEAVEAALAELGPAEQLGRQMKAEIPPFPTSQIRLLRKVGAFLLAMLLGWFLWNIRAWEYGFSWWRAIAVLSITLPLMLLVWPDVVWRRNWLFRWLPSALVFLFCMLAMTVGVQTEYVDGEPTRTPLLSLNTVRLVITLAFVCLSAYLVAMMQQRRQRIGAIVAAIIVVAAIEVPYLVEETYWHGRLRTIQQQLETAKSSGGSYPLADELSGVEHDGFRYQPGPQGERYTLIWDRSLNSHFALGYSSDRDDIWVLD